MTTEVNMYVKRLTQNSISGYLFPPENASFRIGVSFKIDEALYNELIALLNTPFLSVTIDNGVIVAVKKGEEWVTASNEFDFASFVFELLTQNNRMSKKDLYEQIRIKFFMSDKTIQRKLLELTKLNQSIRMDYNNVWRVPNE